MSVELTGMTNNSLPVKLPINQDRESTAVGTEQDTKNKAKETIELVEAREKKLEASAKKNDSHSEKKEITTPQLENVAKQLQEFIGKMNRGLEFLVDEDSGRDVIKVIDKNSGELIKQYPSEEVLSLVSKLSKVTGSFVDSKI